MNDITDKLYIVATVRGSSVMWVQPNAEAVGDRDGLCRHADASAIIAQRDARIAELEATESFLRYGLENAINEAVQQYKWRQEDSECGRDEITEGADRLRARLHPRQSADQDQVVTIHKAGVYRCEGNVRVEAGRFFEVSRQPSAGVVDERTAFDAWFDQFGVGSALYPESTWQGWQARAGLNSCRAQAVPDVLFDGFAVYSALDAKAQRRTSPENVSDTLDAAVRLIRAAAPPSQQKEG